MVQRDSKQAKQCVKSSLMPPEVIQIAVSQTVDASLMLLNLAMIAISFHDFPSLSVPKEVLDPQGP